MVTRSIVTVPYHVAVSSFPWRIEWRGQSAGLGLSAGDQLVNNAFPRFVGSLTPVLRVGRETREWNALIAKARGRQNIYRVYMKDPAGFGRALGGVSADVLASGLPFSGGQYFASGSGFLYRPFVLASGAVSAGATSLRVDISPTGVAPRAGQLMSADDWPFRVTSVLPVSGSIYEIEAEPCIRKAIADGAIISLIATGLFLATEEGGSAAYGRERFVEPKIDLVEHINR